MKRSFAERMKLIRFELGLTQPQMAEKLGYKIYTTIAKFESGQQIPHSKTKIKIGQVLNWNFEKDAPLIAGNDAKYMETVVRLIDEAKIDLATRLEIPIDNIDVLIKF